MEHTRMPHQFGRKSCENPAKLKQAHKRRSLQRDATPKETAQRRLPHRPGRRPAAEERDEARPVTLGSLCPLLLLWSKPATRRPLLWSPCWGDEDSRGQAASRTARGLARSDFMVCIFLTAFQVQVLKYGFGKRWCGQSPRAGSVSATNRGATCRRRGRSCWTASTAEIGSTAALPKRQ